MQGHMGSMCDLALTAGGDSSPSPDLRDYCYFGGSPAFSSSGDYFFRSENTESSTTSLTGGSLVNGLILEDGTKYPLEGLDVDAIVEAVWAPTTVTTFPLINFRSTRRSMEPFMQLSRSSSCLRSRYE